MMIANPYGQAPPGYTYDSSGNLIPIPSTSTGPPGAVSGLPAPGSAGPGSYAAPPGYTYNAATGQYEPTIGLTFGSNETPGGAPGQLTLGPGQTTGVIDGTSMGGTPTIAAPPPTSGGGGGGGGGSFGGGTGAGAGSSPTPFDWPTFTGPSFTPQQGLQAPPPFDPGAAFAAPSLADAQNQPGYQFGLQQGLGAIQNSAAANGTLRGGGALKSLFDYGNAAAEQNYSNVYAQDANTFNTNLGAKLSAYNTNWGTTKDVNTSINAANQANYQDAFQNAAGAFNPQFAAANTSYGELAQQWLARLNSLTNIAVAGGQ